MSAPKSRCPDCLEPLADCCCDEEPGAAPGLTVLRVRAEGGDDPGEPGDDLYRIES